ncbi:methyl-CpG-binding domain protein 1b isoform X2 [Betta splendens]|uniref:Methyl-CpG-binding domain protein 1b isoform X2 n=1 Tax=Betta splendens TaxID=158456 RepID=A0A6P7MNV5_BETSP|nr:methyl-CpG-binding domain protein 1b isoform X2 [Betta splendens]
MGTDRKTRRQHSCRATTGVPVPKGDRVRSKVELLSVLQGVLDLSNFDFKSGKFYDRDTPPIRVRNRLKKKVRERSSSESSFMERGDGADTPDSNHRLTPSGLSLNKQTSYSSSTRVGTPNQVSREKDPTEEETIRLPVPSSFRLRPLPSINGDIGTEDSTLVCARCSASFTGTWYDKQRKRPCCPSCWASKTKEHPMSRFRKWIPCGQCVGCANTVDCGQCANCKHGLQSPESRRRVCRKRKCICPIRKSPGSISFLQSTYNDTPETFDDTCMSFQSEVTDSQLPSVKSSDNDNVNMDVDDDDDFSTDDDDDWHKKRKRRSCGECQACLCRKDCGTCDFCVDKPKFGGSNKKRQKCRLRQCQRQAMRHLLPFQMGQGDCSLDGSLLPGRPRPHYTYSRKPNQIKKNQGPHFNLDFTDNEDDDGYFQEMNWISEPATGSKHSHEPSMRDQQAHFIQQNGLSDRAPYTGNHNNSQPDQQSKWNAESLHPNRNVENHVEQEAEEEENDDEELPMITQIFSLADQSAGSGVDVESQLMKLLQSLRTSVLPILWYAIMVEGPQLQLLQCCKKSSMIDTMVLIDPGFCYQVTVQKQPLLPTHPLYDSFPARLTSANEVVNLLLGLEKYVVCQGLSPRDPHSKSPVILERASTCDFLVDRTVSVCSNCRALQVI